MTKPDQTYSAIQCSERLTVGYRTETFSLINDKHFCEYLLKLRGPWSASELYRLSDRHLTTKFSGNFAYRGVSRGQRGGSPMVVNLSFLDRRRYFSFQ
jgi:hypothetical protein